jgi:hypothetical protein
VSILDHKGERVPGGLAEAIASEGNLDVGVLGHVLNAFIQKPKQVAGKAEESFHKLGGSGTLNLLTVVFEEETKHLADSNHEGAKGNGTQVVAHEPAETGHDGALALSVSGAGEVPDDGRAANDEFSAANKESIDPEEHENLEEENVLGQVNPLDLGHESVGSFARCGGTSGENHDGTSEPKEQPEGANDGGPERKQEDVHVGLDVLGSGLEDSDTQLDGTVAAEHEESHETGKTPQNVGTIGQVLVSLVSFSGLVLFSLDEVSPEATSDESSDNDDEGDPDDSTTDQTDNEKVKVAKDNTNNGTNCKNLPGLDDVHSPTSGGLAVDVALESTLDSVKGFFVNV